MNTDPPLFRALAATLGHPLGHHHYRDDPPDTEEVPIVGRHSDLDGNGVADWAEHPTPPPPVTEIGPDDPEHPTYSRTGDGEPPRWPEPEPDALWALCDSAAVDPDWLHVAAQPIDAGETA